MFKDARLQERLFDQIHAGEFNLEDDFRTAEVGSVMSTVDYRDGSFQRVDDGEVSEPDESAGPRTRKPVAAHIESFVDDVDQTTLQSGSFERVSDDEAESENISTTPTEESPKQTSERSTSKKSKMGKLLSSLGAKKRAPAKRSSTKKAAKEVAPDEAETPASSNEAGLEDSYADAEARIDEGRSRAEFATRRGGRRRRRPSKQGPSDAPVADVSAEEPIPSNSEDHEPETASEAAPIEKTAT